MLTRSGSFPPSVAPHVHSHSHVWVRTHLGQLQQDLRLTYRAVGAEDLAEVAALHKEWFPVTYLDSYFQTINGTSECIAAVVNPADYGDYDTGHDVIVGLIIYRFQSTRFNSYLRFTYLLSTTHSVYIATLGVLEELRGHGIAKELVRQCICQAETSICRPLYIHLHVAVYNEEAIPFYERLGFRRADTLRNYYHILGQPYDAYVYIYYINEAKPPLVVGETVIAAVRQFFRVPELIKSLFLQ